MEFYDVKDLTENVLARRPPYEHKEATIKLTIYSPGGLHINHTTLPHPHPNLHP